MSDFGPNNEVSESLSVPLVRDATCSLKLTASEVQRVDEIASANRKARSEWLRDVVLRELQKSERPDPALAQIIGVHLILINALRAIAARQTITNESFDKLIEKINVIKHELAEKIRAEQRR